MSSNHRSSISDQRVNMNDNRVASPGDARRITIADNRSASLAAAAARRGSILYMLPTNTKGEQFSDESVSLEFIQAHEQELLDFFRDNLRVDVDSKQAPDQLLEFFGIRLDEALVDRFEANKVDLRFSGHRKSDASATKTRPYESLKHETAI